MLSDTVVSPYVQGTILWLTRLLPLNWSTEYEFTVESKVAAPCACRIVVVLPLMWVCEGLNPGCHGNLFQASSIHSDTIAFVY